MMSCKCAKSFLLCRSACVRAHAESILFLSTLRCCEIKAVCHSGLAVQVVVQKLVDDSAYQGMYITIKNKLSAKGMRPTGFLDPQDNTAEDTLTPQQYEDLMKLLLRSSRPESVRDRSIFAHLYASIGRADEGRMIYTADMMPPRQLSCIGVLLSLTQ